MAGVSVVGTDTTIGRLGTAWGPVWQVRGYEDVRQVLFDDRFQPVRPTSAVNVLLAEGRFDEASRLRERDPDAAADGSGGTEFDNATRVLRLRVMNTVAAPHNVRRRTGEMRKLADELSRHLAALPPPVNASQGYTAPLCARAMRVLLGISADESARFVSYVGSSTSAAGIAGVSPRVRDLIGRRQRDPRPDVVSDLVATVHDRRQLAQLTNVFTWLLMGSNWEVPSAVIDFALAQLFANPAQHRRLAADPDLLYTAVEETFRLFVAAEVERGGLVRRAVADVELGGVPVRAGDFVLADVAAANRDPRVFPDPAAFDAGRWPNPHLTFGHGTFMCKFIPMSRALVATGLHSLLAAVPGIRPAAAPAGPDPTERIRGDEFEDLWVTW
jgi:cytochrome P450 monooxygenase